MVDPLETLESPVRKQTFNELIHTVYVATAGATQANKDLWTESQSKSGNYLWSKWEAMIAKM